MSSFFKYILATLLITSYSTSCGCATLFDFSSSNNFKNAPRKSFVQIDVSTPDGESLGSGVIINHINNSNTIILTAGHICKPNTIEMKVLDLYEKPFKMVGMINSKEDDLCLVIVEGIIDGPALKAGNSYPEIGDHVFNIAAPHGIHGPNMSLMFDGYYQGDLMFTGEKHTLSIFSTPGMGGSSGSPIFNKNFEVIGVVSRGLVDFHEFMLCVNQDRTKKMIERSYGEEFIVEMNAAIANRQIILFDLLKKLFEN